jgi:hypothetical protein
MSTRQVFIVEADHFSTPNFMQSNDLWIRIVDRILKFKDFVYHFQEATIVCAAARRFGKQR